MNGDLFKCARRLNVYFGLYSYTSTSQKIASNGKVFLTYEFIMWKERIWLMLKYCPAAFLKGLKKIKKNLSKYIRCPCIDSN